MRLVDSAVAGDGDAADAIVPVSVEAVVLLNVDTLAVVGVMNACLAMTLRRLPMHCLLVWLYRVVGCFI